MFGSLLRPRGGRRSPSRSPFSVNSRQREYEQDAEHEDDEDDGEQDWAEEEEDNEDGQHGDESLLPLFSSEVLDKLPIYNMTHAIRILIVQKVETTLSWDQLRSPQISQFLVKPIQQQIQAKHWNRATLYTLVANQLQFTKEGQLYPGNVGVSRSRGMMCELLAMRLLKEYSTRELIDALSYDFDPLQGMAAPANVPGAVSAFNKIRIASATTRISTIEIAIRAQSKRLLAHPLVVSQLESIWAGTIVFHSAADNLHRVSSGLLRRTDNRNYGTLSTKPQGIAATLRYQLSRQKPDIPPLNERSARRSVTLYDPTDASLFKLSRLRVPRYRQIFSTTSFAIMLGLFISVLYERSLDITPMEILFWIWSAGFMLDEIVGFTEQGFGLYIMSVWNALDLGILALFLVYYILRLYGLVMPDARKHHVASMAYDVLASTAVLLFPRLFSVLDHSRYFSQLLIAFRMMALDMVAILFLILIACSGFFVAFTLSFGDETFNAPAAAYALFQMVMGFTPAAWEIWDDYNFLGKTLLTLFLFICHFLIVTILITVLTNSFMAVVKNAEEEHQFLFAVNTISMVKSDALFSYIAPTNVIGWLISPLRYVMPFREFIKFNRTVIKITHLPILFSIFAYERVIMAYFVVEPTDLVEQRGRRISRRTPTFANPNNGIPEIFSPGTRLREPSISTFRKDRVLDEVFSRPFRDLTLPKMEEETKSERRKSSNVVRDWMQGMGDTGGASTPEEQPQSVLDRLETRGTVRRHPRSGRGRRNVSSRTVVSDPEEQSYAPSFSRPIMEEDLPTMSLDDLPHQTDADGDDELGAIDEDDAMTMSKSNRDTEDKENRQEDDGDQSDNEQDYFSTPATYKAPTPKFTGSFSPATRARLVESTNTTPGPAGRVPPRHNRNISSTTILYSPMNNEDHSSSEAPAFKRPPTNRGLTALAEKRASTRPNTRPSTPGGLFPGHRSPAKSRPQNGAAKTRPGMPSRYTQLSTPNLATFLSFEREQRRAPSFNARALDLASDLGDNRYGPDVAAIANMPMSVSGHMPAGGARGGGEDTGMVSRIMLARMTTLEQGFMEVLKEVKGIRKEGTSAAASKTGSKGSSVVTRMKD